MKNAINKIIIIFFIILTCVSLIFINRLLRPKSLHGIRQTEAMYAQPRNSIDVVFMGSSHVYYDINTALLWEDYGIASYDYGAAEQPLWITYHYLREICKYQKPGLVVLDLYCPARFKADYQYAYLKENVQGMRFSLNKLQMISVACEPELIFDYIPGIGDYHDRYDELTDEDWEYALMSDYDKASFKGYTPYSNVSPQEEPELDMRESGGLTMKSEIYLQKIINYTEANDIDLFLIVTPYPTTDDDELVYNRVHEIADQHGIDFNSTNYFYEHMDLDFDTDFNDDSHLNYEGGLKFTKYLGTELKERFEIPDRRNDPYYESWDRHVIEINELME